VALKPGVSERDRAMEQGSTGLGEGAPRARERKGPTSPVYSVELEVFEGPLDLLLHLVRKHELDILDIPIAFVAEKYLAYLDVMRQLDLEIAGDYLVMAATLAYLKSRELLPPEPRAGEAGQSEEDEGEDPREALIRRLVEYERFKQAAAELDSLPMSGRDVFARGAELVMPPIDPGLAPVSLFNLAEAYYRVLTRAKVKSTHDVQIEAVTVAQRIKQLALILDEKPHFEFEELFLGRTWNSERELRAMLVVTLMSILEMVKLGVAGVQQPHDTPNIRIYRRATAEQTQQALADYDEDASFGAPPPKADDAAPAPATPARPPSEAELDAVEEAALLAEALASVQEPEEPVLGYDEEDEGVAANDPAASDDDDDATSRRVASRLPRTRGRGAGAAEREIEAVLEDMEDVSGDMWPEDAARSAGAAREAERERRAVSSERGAPATGETDEPVPVHELEDGDGGALRDENVPRDSLARGAAEHPARDVGGDAGIREPADRSEAGDVLSEEGDREARSTAGAGVDVDGDAVALDRSNESDVATPNGEGEAAHVDREAATFGTPKEEGDGEPRSTDGAVVEADGVAATFGTPEESGADVLSEDVDDESRVRAVVGVDSEAATPGASNEAGAGRFVDRSGEDEDVRSNSSVVTLRASEESETGDVLSEGEGQARSSRELAARSDDDEDVRALGETVTFGAPGGDARDVVSLEGDGEERVTEGAVAGVDSAGVTLETSDHDVLADCEAATRGVPSEVAAGDSQVRGGAAVRLDWAVAALSTTDEALPEEGDGEARSTAGKAVHADSDEVTGGAPGESGVEAGRVESESVREDSDAVTLEAPDESGAGLRGVETDSEDVRSDRAQAPSSATEETDASAADVQGIAADESVRGEGNLAATNVGDGGPYGLQTAAAERGADEAALGDDREAARGAHGESDGREVVRENRDADEHAWIASTVVFPDSDDAEIGADEVRGGVSPDRDVGQVTETEIEAAEAVSPRSDDGEVGADEVREAVSPDRYDGQVTEAELETAEAASPGSDDGQVAAGEDEVREAVSADSDARQVAAGEDEVREAVSADSDARQVAAAEREAAEAVFSDRYDGQVAAGEDEASEAVSADSDVGPVATGEDDASEAVFPDSEAGQVAASEGEVREAVSPDSDEGEAAEAEREAAEAVLSDSDEEAAGGLFLNTGKGLGARELGEVDDEDDAQ